MLAAVQKDPELVCDSLDVRFPVKSPLMLAIITESPLNYPVNPDQSVTARLNLTNLDNALILTNPAKRCRISACISNERCGESTDSS